jgi:hypothetical protein
LRQTHALEVITMRRATIQLAIIAAIIALTSVPLAAKPSTPKGPKAPKATVTKTHVPKSTTKAPKPAKVSSPKAAKSSTPKSAKATAPKGSTPKGSPTDSTGTPTTTTTSTTQTTPVYTNAVAQKLSTNPNQLARLERALGLGTLTPAQINGATSGFKNFGQLNAAVNTTLNNPGVQFAELKGLMTGLDMKGMPIEGQTATYSLGQAKQRLGIVEGSDTGR